MWRCCYLVVGGEYFAPARSALPETHPSLPYRSPIRHNPKNLQTKTISRKSALALSVLLGSNLPTPSPESLRPPMPEDLLLDIDLRDDLRMKDETDQGKGREGGGESTHV